MEDAINTVLNSKLSHVRQKKENAQSIENHRVIRTYITLHLYKTTKPLPTHNAQTQVNSVGCVQCLCSDCNLLTLNLNKNSFNHSIASKPSRKQDL
jgi:hypothetical protein